MECNDDSIQKWNFASQRKLNLRENERNKVRYWLKLRKRHISELQAKETAEVERERETEDSVHYSVRYLMIASLKIPSCFIFDPKMSSSINRSNINCSDNAIATSQATILDSIEMRRNNTGQEKRRRFPTSRNDIRKQIDSDKST